MPRYIDADALYKETKKGIAEANENRMALVDDEFLDLINDAYIEEDVVEVVRCKDCEVPHNKWTGCPNLNGLIPPPEHFCAKGVRKRTEAKENTTCRVCEKITYANKDIFWVFARTHQPEDKEEFHQVPVRFCPVCGREIERERKLESWEEKENRYV